MNAKKNFKILILLKTKKKKRKKNYSNPCKISIRKINFFLNVLLNI